MTFFAEEETTKHSNSCGVLASAVKEAFAQCHLFPNGRGSVSSVSVDSEDENPDGEIDDDRVIILAVRNRMIKGRLGRRNRLMTKSLSWAFSPSTGELYVAPAQAFETKSKTKLDEEKEKENDDDHDEEEDGEEETESFYSVRSRFSRSSSASRVDDGQILTRRRSVLEEFCDCEGWPFGLYRRSLILPPLPSSPSEPWTWCRRRGLKMMRPLP
ncbi:hypothetical protein H6P81_010894 [Aristolochia fimbriata]|uniref:Uncharacterized protein n=1 Tax=Aristolochia fimbriata TaxID=158543 RepID=A0AAV7EQR3_ARIFI|nr:hypothetical protein H6P81_010894 [Aristolochia fimbriata]